jgi:flagellar capping protein FliD
MLKVPVAKTAAFFLAASALALTPPASIAIEDCGTSRTECELRQQIKDLQRQVAELQAAQSSLRQKIDAFSVSSIDAGNSDLYFTKTDHNHTGRGNAPGFAAIENAADYNALMILGRAGTPKGRYVRLWDYLQVNGSMDVTGYIDAGNSDLYFTKTDHNHTARGNAPGFAAIENAANYNALMILGRAGTPKGRYVRLWDYLQVNGSMDVTGTIYGHNVTPSDQRLKQNIHPLDNALTKLQGLRGVNFEWKKSQDQEAGTQIGLIAQEVEGVLPELVSTDGDGYKSIAYGQLSAVLIEAVKEQQQIIEQKSATIAELQLSLQEQQKENAALQDNQAAQAERIASLEAMMQGMTQQMAAMTRQMEAIKAAVPQPVKTRLH